MLKIDLPFFGKLTNIISHQLIALNSNEIETLYLRWEKEFSANLDFLLDKRNKELIRDYQNVDLFIHDSDHSYEVMSYECDLISKEYSTVDIIIDDFSYNKYYLDYKKKTHKDFFLINDIDDNLNEVKKSVYFPFIKKTT